MADERYDISITKEYLIRNKAKLLYISSATYSGDWLSTPHTHYCSELFYVLEGIGQFQVEDKIFPVKANDLIKKQKMAGTIKQDADGMAKAIALLTQNALAEKDLMDGTKDYNVDKKAAKIRIAYGKYLGE